VKKSFPKTKIYQDWRELSTRKRRNIGSVNVDTRPQARERGYERVAIGKHLYGQNPLAHDLYEVGGCTELATREKEGTQMGIQNPMPKHIEWRFTSLAGRDWKD